MKKFLTLGLVVTFLLSANIVFAKTNIVQAQAPLIPNVYIKNIQLEKTNLISGEKVSGTFQALTDSKNAASDIYFKISLVGDYQKNTLASAFYDSITMSSSYNFKAGETKTVNFSYTIPSVKTGISYGIQIQAMTHTGIPLGWSDALVKITNTGSAQFLDIVSAKLSVGTSTFGLQQGPMVPSGQKAILDLVISNPTSQSVTLTPTIALYDHVVLGKPLKTVSASSTTIAAGKQKEIFITLPTNNNAPLVYVSHITFPDVNKTERLTAIDARYIIQGDIATIQSVSTGKESFNKGDSVAVTLVYSGTPFDITTGKNPTDATYDTAVKLLNDQNQVIASWTGSIDYNATSSKTLVLTAEQAANGYTVDVTVTKAGKIVTHYVSKIAPDVESLVNKTSPSFWLYILYGIIIGAIIIFIIILMRRNKRLGAIVFALVLLAGLTYVVSSFSTIQKVEAQVGSMTGGSVIDYLGLTTANTTAEPVPDPIKTYSPGEAFWVRGSAISWGCTNSSAALVKSRVKIYNTAGTLISDSGDIASTGAQFFNAPNGQWSGDKFQFGVQYAISVTAPTVPGTYRLHLSTISYFLIVNAATGWEGDQTITVRPPPPPTVTLTANPRIVTLVGGAAQTTLTWNAPNAVACTPENYDSFVLQPVSGSKQISLDRTTTYYRSCYGFGGTASASVTVFVATPPPTLTFSASSAIHGSPTKVEVGRSFNLNWSLFNPVAVETSPRPITAWQRILSYFGFDTEVTHASVSFSSGIVSAPGSNGQTCTGTGGDWAAIGENKTVQYGVTATESHVAPSTSQTLTYTITCHGNGYWTSPSISRSATVDVVDSCNNGAIDPPTCTPPPVITCKPQTTDAGVLHDPAKFANVGQLVTWHADSAGAWTEDGAVVNLTGDTYRVRYSTIGNKRVYVNGNLCTANNTLSNGLPVINDPNFHEF